MTKTIDNLESLGKGSKVYFIGISGISMCGLAEISHHLSYQVAGSDPRKTLQIIKLESMGVIHYQEQLAENIDSFQPDLVVYTLAIPESNPELQRARELNITCMNRADYLGLITRSYKSVINIAGTHGKTTTTAMCSKILIESGVDPTVHLGADFDDFDSSTVHLGDNSNLLISEACEYKNAFLSFYSTTSAILNIDEDHLDFFTSLDNIIDTFVQFAAELPSEGNLIIPYSDAHMAIFMKKLRQNRIAASKNMPNIITFGSYQENNVIQADFYYKDLEYIDGLPHFSVYYNDELYRHIKLAVPGEHNVKNAMAAIACSHVNGGTPEAAAKALASFKGAGGRFTHIGYYKGAELIADYAHHPTEITATLLGAKQLPHRKIWPVFQIINYSRAQEQYKGFIDAFDGFDDVIFYKIYSSRENDNLGMSAERFASEIQDLGRIAHAANSLEELKSILDTEIDANDIVIFMGPESLRDIASEISKMN